MVHRPLQRAVLLCLCAALASACFDPPDYSGRLCSLEEPCPAGWICTLDQRCAGAEALDAAVKDSATAPDAADAAGPEDSGRSDASAPPDAGAREVTLSVLGTADDAMEGPPNGATLFDYPWVSLYSPAHLGGLRFLLPADLTASATILAAELEVYVDSDGEDTPDTAVACELSLLPAPFGAGPGDIAGRRLGAAITWAAADLGAGWRRSPGLAALLSEVRSQPGWQPGGAVVFVLRERSSATFELRQFDHPPASMFAPRLILRYVP